MQSTEPTEDFPWHEIEPESTPEAPEAVLEFSRRAAVGVLLEILTHGTDATGAGRRALILRHELRFGTHRRKKDLAAAIGVSPGRLSQLLKSMSATIAQLNRALDDVGPSAG